MKTKKGKAAPAPGWPADQVRRVPIGDLEPYARNARTHSPEQIAQLAKSIEQFGFTVPVLVDEKGGIIAGHGRVLAAKKLKLRDVPVVTATGWSDEKKRAYVILDNKVALNSGWDEEILRVELEELQSGSFQLGDLGFTQDEFASLDPLPDVSQESASVPRSNRTIIQFNTVFDDTEQQNEWFKFVRHLKTKYPDEATLAARLAHFLKDLAPSTGTITIQIACSRQSSGSSSAASFSQDGCSQC